MEWWSNGVMQKPRQPAEARAVKDDGCRQYRSAPPVIALSVSFPEVVYNQPLRNPDTPNCVSFPTLQYSAPPTLH